MKRLVILLLLLCLLCGCTAKNEPSEVMTKSQPRKVEPVIDQSLEVTGKDLYIETARLSEEEQTLLDLIDFGHSRYAFYDFVIEDTVHQLFFKTYVFKDGQWQITPAEQTNGSRALSYSTSGRLLLDSKDLSRRLYIALQRADGSGYIGTAYDTGSSVFDSGMFTTYTLPKRTGILHDQEIPLVLKVIPHDHSINKDDIHTIFENFSNPSAFAESAAKFEQLYAVTITFSQVEKD